MAMGSKDGGQGSSKSKSTKQLIGGSSQILGGGLVVGIATVVVVGVAGKLLSKLRKPKGSTNTTATPFFTPSNSLDKIVNEDLDLLKHLKGKAQLPIEATLNGKNVVSVDHQNGRLDLKHKAILELLDEMSLALEYFSGDGELSMELPPALAQRLASLEMNNSSGSEEEAAQVHPGELLTEQEVVLPDSTTTEADKQINESNNHDTQMSHPEKVPCIVRQSSSPPFQEHEEEPKDTTTGRNEADRGEQPLLQEEADTLSSSESTNPKEVVSEIQQEKIEPDGTLGVLEVKEAIKEGVLEVKDAIKEVASLLDDTTNLSLTANGTSNDDAAVKKGTLSQECAQVYKEAEIFQLNDGTRTEILKLTPILLRSKNSSLTETTTADQDVNSAQILTKIVDEKEGMSVTVPSSLVAPSSSCQGSNITKIVAAKESAGATGTHSKPTIVTTAELNSCTTKDLKPALEEGRRGNRLSHEVLALTVIVALIAVLVWSMSTAHASPSLVRR